MKSEQSTMKIMLGDLRHKTLGKHSSLVPLGIGMVASYCKNKFKEKVDIRIYDDPEKALDDIDVWEPDVVGLSNYMWNTELNRIIFEYSNEKNKNVICIAGGPEFPTDLDKCQNYLIERSEIDFYVALEGEVAFSALIKKFLLGYDKNSVKVNPLKGIFSINRESDTLVFGGYLPRNNNLDDIPSPYLTGMFDEWLNGEYMPSIQTSRGCPFVCGYCRAGSSLYSNVYKFGLGRVKKELTYIAKMISSYKNIPLYIFDSNFGLFIRDELIADHIAILQETYSWPESILADTIQTKYERMARITEKMKNRLNTFVSVQTFNEGTLNAIKRKNIPRNKYKSVIQDWYLSKGKAPGADLIMPLPEETIESYMEGIKFIFDSGVEQIIPFTWMLLPGTALEQNEAREKYGIKSAFRIIPRQFGKYRGKLCIEIEEVCCETSPFSFDDYLKGRKFAFLSFLFVRMQYDFLRRHLLDFSVGISNFMDRMFTKLESGNSAFNILCNNLVQETRDELYESRGTIYEVFLCEENYNKLLLGEVGDNIFRKYLAKVLSTCFSSSLDLAYDVLEEYADDTEKIESLRAAKQFLLLSRDFAQIFHDDKSIVWEETTNSVYDVKSWALNEKSKEPLWSYKSQVNYRLFWEKNSLKELVKQIIKRYGKDPEYLIGKALFEYSPDVFWRKCEYLREQH